MFSPNTAATILSRSPPRCSAGEIAARRKDYDKAIAHLDRAVRLESASSTRSRRSGTTRRGSRSGAVLLAAGRPKEAETVYWDDLRQQPENGWALFGLVQALRAQGRNDEAAAAQARFDKAWTRADAKLTASRF